MDNSEDFSVLINEFTPTHIDKIQNKNYLNKNGINPNNPVQLNLIFPGTIGERDDQRFIPNDYARSSLFTARNKRVPRKTLTCKKLFHLNESIAILYTGIELRAEDDELVWLQILNYGKSVPIGEPFEFSVKDLIRDLGWSKNGHYYEKVFECISRLRATDVLAKNTKAYGKSGSVSLIADYSIINDAVGKSTYYRATISPAIIALFAGNTFTNHAWEIYRDLSPVARRLADYIDSHKQPFPLKLERLRQMCGSDDMLAKSWRVTVKKACAEIQVKGLAKQVQLDSNDDIITIR